MPLPEIVSPEERESLKALGQPSLEESLKGTFSGEVLDRVKELGEKDGETASIDEFRWGRYVYHLGDEEALSQNHIVDGVNRHHTIMTDLQKPWWKDAFLNVGCNGKIENVGLISPSILDVVKTFNKEAAGKFTLANILKELGEQNTQDLPDEFVEQDILGEDLNEKLQTLSNKVIEYLNTLVGPDFKVAFSNGDGDLYRKIRLIPQNNEATQALCYGGPKFQEIAKKIVENYDGLIAYLK